jgi:hypothetical protein
VSTEAGIAIPAQLGPIYPRIPIIPGVPGEGGGISVNNRSANQARSSIARPHPGFAVPGVEDGCYLAGRYRNGGPRHWRKDQWTSGMA